MGAEYIISPGNQILALTAKKAIPKNNYLKNYVTAMLHICSKYTENNLI